MAKGLSKERIHSIYEKNKADIPHIPSDISSAENLEAIKAQMLDMQMEIDILKETINVLKKCLRHLNPLTPILGGIRGFFLLHFPS